MGYTFGGWYAFSDYSGSKITDATIVATASNHALFAKWTAHTYTVQYFANGGAGTMVSSVHTYDAAKTLTANAFTRTGYTFAGWATSATGSVVYNNAESVKNLTATDGATIALYAIWTVHTYTVQYDANGGSGSMSSVSHTYDAEKALAGNAFTRTGYTFDGWAASATGSAVYSDAERVKNLSSENGATVTLYAIWTVHTYTVRYYSNGGVGPTADSSHTYDAAKALTRNGFTRTGYTFSGWATSATGSVAHSDGESVTNLTATDGATFKLYAVWTAHTYTVQYNANGGSGTMASVLHTYDVEKVLTDNAFTRTGYTYKGWAASASGPVAYSDKQSVKNLTATDNGLVTLYAVWTANTYTVSFDADGGTVSPTTQTKRFDSAYGKADDGTTTAARAHAGEDGLYVLRLVRVLRLFGFENHGFDHCRHRFEPHAVCQMDAQRLHGNVQRGRRIGVPRDSDEAIRQHLRQGFRRHDGRSAAHAGQGGLYVRRLADGQGRRRHADPECDRVRHGE